MNIICLDTETTGFRKDDEVLQLAICDSNGKRLFNRYFRPESKTSWPEAEAINHISYEMVRDCKPITFYKQEIEGLINNADLVVGYNHESFDLKMLRQVGLELQPKASYDVMIKFAPVFGEWNSAKNDYKWQKLGVCADYFNYKWSGNAHDAEADAKATMYCYTKMQELKKAPGMER